MMERVDRDPGLTHCGCDARSRLDHDVVCPCVAHIVHAFGIVRERVPHARRDILNQGAAERDVQKLRAAADCKNRFPGLARGEHKSYFSLVATAVHCAETLVPLLSVQCGIDVLAAGEYKAVDGRDYAARCRSVREWRNYDWYEPC